MSVLSILEGENEPVAIVGMGDTPFFQYSSRDVLVLNDLFSL